MVNGPVFVVGTPKSRTTSLHYWIRDVTGLPDFGLKEAGVLLSENCASELEGTPRAVDSNPWAYYSASAAERASGLEGAVFIVCLREPVGRALSMLEDQRRVMRNVTDDFTTSALRPVDAANVVEQSRYWRYWPQWSTLAARGQVHFFDSSGDSTPQLARLAEVLAVSCPAELLPPLPYANRATPRAVLPLQPLIRAAVRLGRRSRTVRSVWAARRLQLMRLLEMIGSVRLPAPQRSSESSRGERTAEALQEALSGPEWREFRSAVHAYWLDSEPDWLISRAERPSG